jgi:hypothetical protein
MIWIDTYERVFTGYSIETGLEHSIKQISIRIDDITSYSESDEHSSIISMYNGNVHIVEMTYKEISDIINGYITFPQHLN